jgi:hypothetical protein
VAAGLTVGLGIVLTRAVGLVGLCLGVLAGRAVQSVAYPLLARASLGGTGGGSVGPLRPALVSVVVFATAAIAGPRITAAGWMEWGAGVVATAPTLAALCLAAGAGPEGRRVLLRRWRNLTGPRRAS